VRIEPSAVTAVEVITATRIIVETSVKAARIVGAVGKGAEKENYRAESYGVPFRKRGDETHGQTSPQQPQLSVRDRNSRSRYSGERKASGYWWLQALRKVPKSAENRN
jgi:hypothetical protein